MWEVVSRIKGGLKRKREESALRRDLYAASPQFREDLIAALDRQS